ncbi:MAG TPA: GerMN domain-containing protein [Candidatus Sumerlaeota bacterium]|nr:MAG: Sporulation and spore germination [candidate division BRC1 bacterium ADurb.BinA292]HOE95065.1 GerMN domain-containing protein [Candidatus Sumerlaeota bacterium]HOR26436.1 GerMN domain-containing protein [Candidatus Sumerlaeota bacterium]HPK02825.1 GerMN domain-containing protein [Candidatus Sumerlaeota bacterium]
MTGRKRERSEAEAAAASNADEVRRLLEREGAVAVDTAEAWTEPPDELEEEVREWGCGWLLLLILLGLTSLFAVGWWGVNEITRRNMVEKLDKSFFHLSLLPQPKVETAEPDLTVQIFYLVRGRGLAAQKRELRYHADSRERLYQIAHEMQRPPTTGLLESPFPKGTEIRAIYLHDGIIWIDLNEAFLQPEHPSPLLERLVIFAIVNNFMLNEPTYRGVRFMIEGQPVNSAWGWLDLSSPLGPDLSLIE